ncbi:hypothetical protein EBU99_08560 [bacterium]|nr:hypothetical protein [bacterium]
MKSHSIVAPRCRWILPLFFMLYSQVSTAGAFNCEHLSEGPEPALVCNDAATATGDFTAWVTLRKMPAWRTHAGLTIIDLCLRNLQQYPLSSQPKLIVDPPQKSKASAGPGEICERRYCTDKKHAFSFFINSIPFPIGWTAVSFRLGFDQQSFSITCDELSSEELGIAGEQS